MPIQVPFDQLEGWSKLVVGAHLAPGGRLRLGIGGDSECVVSLDDDLFQPRAAAHVPSQRYGRVGLSNHSSPIHKLLGGGVLAVNDQRRLGEHLFVIGEPVARHAAVVVVPAGP